MSRAIPAYKGAGNNFMAFCPEIVGKRNSQNYIIFDYEQIVFHVVSHVLSNSTKKVVPTFFLLVTEISPP
jgi:hypothetical protein